MIVRATARIALLRPVADVAVRGGLGVGAGSRTVAPQRIRRHVRLEPAPRHAVVGREVVHPESLGIIAAAERQMHVLRRTSLHRRQQVRVERDLQDRARLRLAGQLRVHHLVGPVPEIAANRHAQQKIGLPEPASVEQDALKDHVRAHLHRGVRRLGTGCPAFSRGNTGLRLGDLGHSSVTRPQLRQELRLVLQSATAQHFRPRVFVRARFRALAERHRTGEARQMWAGQVVAEVRRCEDEPVSDQMHGASGWSGASVGRRRGLRCGPALRLWY